MKTYDHIAPEAARPFRSAGSCRAHPWTDAVADSAFRYYDFKRAPQLVRTVLEDFRPWAGRPAIETFYRLVEWTNGPDSLLETNDCAFEGPHPNESLEFSKSLEVTGRVVVLWRDLTRNLSLGQIERLEGRMHEHLNRFDPDFRWGVVGMTVLRARYVTLPLPEDQQLGFQLVLSFWSWGDDDDDLWANLNRTLRNLWKALREVVREARGLLA